MIWAMALLRTVPAKVWAGILIFLGAVAWVARELRRARREGGRSVRDEYERRTAAARDAMATADAEGPRTPDAAARRLRDGEF